MFDTETKQKEVRGPYRKSPKWPYSFMQTRIKAIQDEHKQALIAIAYANGMRLNEALAIKFNDFTFGDEYLYINQIVLKKGKDSPIEKKVRAPPTSIKNEAWLVELIRGYINRHSQKPQETDDRLIFTFNQRTAQRIANETLGIKFHALRHLRVRHLRQYLNYDLPLIQKFFHLSNRGLVKWINTYADIDTKILEEHLESVATKKEVAKPKIQESDDVFG